MHTHTHICTTYTHVADISFTCVHLTLGRQDSNGSYTRVVPISASKSGSWFSRTHPASCPHPASSPRFLSPTLVALTPTFEPGRESFPLSKGSARACAHTQARLGKGERRGLLPDPAHVQGLEVQGQDLRTHTQAGMGQKSPADVWASVRKPPACASPPWLSEVHGEKKVGAFGNPFCGGLNRIAPRGSCLNACSPVGETARD